MTNEDIITPFRKSSHSQSGTQECVEVAVTARGGRAVRDSKDPDAGIQFCSSSAWDAFMKAVHDGALT